MPPANSARHTPEHTPHVRGTCSVLLRGCCALACSSTSECCAHQLHSLTMRTAYKSGSISWQVCALSLVACDHPCCQDLESSCRCETHRPVSTSASRQSQPIAKMTVVACIPYALPCACARPRTVPTAAWRRRRGRGVTLQLVQGRTGFPLLQSTLVRQISWTSRSPHFNTQVWRLLQVYSLKAPAAKPTPYLTDPLIIYHN